ncbi:RING finger protein 214 isoform X2 [Salminus brasiliensis]|uniref:RING finger protein 214 isoform X2 n=1 Tax=Salminus brasiliensis TaxID=930266 RepID=UPI003B82CC35
MESEVQTDWSLSLEDDLVAGNIPVCASLWAAPAPAATLWAVPGHVRGQSPVADQEALLFGHEFDIMPTNTETKDFDIQTEDWTEEKASGTNDDWESAMHTINEYSARLAQQYESLVRQGDADETEHALHVESLKKMRDEKQQNYQLLISKIESLHVKLDLNSSKTTRKNFTVKLEELTTEKERLAEGKKRLAQEFEEADRKLKLLIEEQNNDKVSWEQEIADLQTEHERLSKQVEEASQIALKDEIAVLESERELAISQIEDWIAEAEKYIGTLWSPQHARQRHEWEKNILIVRNSLSSLQNTYNENLKLLQNGQQLDSLPPVSLPPLPNVPSIELFMSAPRNSMHVPYYSSPMIRIPPPTTLPEFPPGSVPIHRPTSPLPTVSSQSLPAPTVAASSYAAGPKPKLTMPTVFPSHLSFRMPTMPAVPSMPLPHTSPHAHSMYGLPHTIAPTSTYGATGPAHVSMAMTHAAAPMATAALPQGTLSFAPIRNASPQTVPSNPPPAGKLDKVLERLGTHFPQCTRTQLTGVLQQIKSERGTMAGLSMDEVIQQVSQKLAQNDRPAPGPIAPPSGSRGFAALPRPIQRTVVQPHPMRPPFQAPSVSVFQPKPSQAPPIRKLCLMCQNHVEPGTQYNTNCPHTLHKECISVWLQSSKDHSCPFCPSK